MRKKITATDTLEMSIPERIQLVEDIWNTIKARAYLIEISEEEKGVIDARLAEYHKNPDAGSPWSEVYARIVGE